MKVLITGFDPFGGEAMNPAYEAVKLLPDSIEGAEVIKLEVPTVFGKSIEVLEAAITEHQPDYVITVGQAGGRFGITPERVAINQDDARIKDNEGNQPIDESIREDGAPATAHRCRHQLFLPASGEEGEYDHADVLSAGRHHHGRLRGLPLRPHHP